ncbi:hypothetical protein AALP_AA6G206600 [Arabis alpina]|uniref:Uncharacterized protein n=1 Tax=Arabis alpina TaxID=50452 RepID=A0A087GQL6_ARAAL|nr:hypothetical protein AALP_AA6G206600 [Arabis alpina]
MQNHQKSLSEVMKDLQKDMEEVKKQLHKRMMSEIARLKQLIDEGTTTAETRLSYASMIGTQHRRKRPERKKTLEEETLASAGSDSNHHPTVESNPPEKISEEKTDRIAIPLFVSDPVIAMVVCEKIATKAAEEDGMDSCENQGNLFQEEDLGKKTEGKLTEEEFLGLHDTKEKDVHQQEEENQREAAMDKRVRATKIVKWKVLGLNYSGGEKLHGHHRSLTKQLSVLGVQEDKSDNQWLQVMRINSVVVMIESYATHTYNCEKTRLDLSIVTTNGRVVLTGTQVTTKGMQDGMVVELLMESFSVIRGLLPLRLGGIDDIHETYQVLKHLKDNQHMYIEVAFSDNKQVVFQPNSGYQRQYPRNIIKAENEEEIFIKWKYQSPLCNLEDKGMLVADGGMQTEEARGIVHPPADPSTLVDAFHHRFGEYQLMVLLELSTEIVIAFIPPQLREDGVLEVTTTEAVGYSYESKQFLTHDLEDKVDFKGTGIVTRRNIRSVILYHFRRKARTHKALASLDPELLEESMNKPRHRGEHMVDTSRARGSSLLYR